MGSEMCIRDSYDASLADVASVVRPAAISDIAVIALATVLYDVHDFEVVDRASMFAVVGTEAVPIAYDTTLAHSWHTPLNWGDFLRSPQKALWRTAMELKMDTYKALDMFALEPEADVLAAGHKIMPTVWAFKIKLDKHGVFEKLNPRWCVVGTGMDRDVYESFADVVRFTTVLVLVALRSSYKLIDFQFDVCDAFQATRTDDDPDDPPPLLYYRQATGFDTRGPNGERLVCRALTGHQGRIDSARLFGTKFGRTLLRRAGCRRHMWDPKLWGFHRGKLASSSDDLERVLNAYALEPGTPDAPNGVAFFGTHVDDGLGVASSQAVLDYLYARIRTDWAIKTSGWKKVLGYGITVNPETGVVVVDCLPVIANLVREHSIGEAVIQPKHPYSGAITSLGYGVKPPAGSPELMEFEAMQAKCRSGLGASIWASRAHSKLTFPINFACGWMSNPSVEVYKVFKHAVFHEHAFPRPLTFGGGGLRSLNSVASPVMPFTSGQYDYGLHIFVDASLAEPPDESAPVAAGSAGAASDNGRSLTGIVIMLSLIHI